MNLNPPLFLTDEVADALAEARPVITMESTLITHGLPYPDNIAVATLMENRVRELGVVPATIAVLNGRIHVGLSRDELEWIATQDKATLMRCSRRNLSLAMATAASGATTVAGTMVVSSLAGIPIMTTGAIGGVHRNASFDVSADLTELGRTPTTVVCSGVKPFLDIGATREVLETQGVLVMGLQTEDIAPFFNQHSGVSGDFVAGSALEIARIIKANQDMGMGSGMLVTVPVPEQYRFDYNELEAIFVSAVADMQQKGIRGAGVTNWMIKRLVAELGRNSILGNIELLILNATVAAEVAIALSSFHYGISRQ